MPSLFGVVTYCTYRSNFSFPPCISWKRGRCERSRAFFCGEGKKTSASSAPVDSVSNGVYYSHKNISRIHPHLKTKQYRKKNRNGSICLGATKNSTGST